MDVIVITNEEPKKEEEQEQLQPRPEDYTELGLQTVEEADNGNN